MKKLYIYIHGFASSGQGGKAQLFKTHYKDEHYLCPSLSYVPALAIDTLENIIESFHKSYEIILLGSSLGGFYSLYLSQKYDLRAVLINPAMVSFDTLGRYEGFNTNFFDGSQFEMRAEHLDFLRMLYIDEIENQSKLLLMLQKGDEVLDYRLALKRLDRAAVILEEGGNHSFDGIEAHFETIDAFIGR